MTVWRRLEWALASSLMSPTGEPACCEKRVPTSPGWIPSPGPGRPAFSVSDSPSPPLVFLIKLREGGGVGCCYYSAVGRKSQIPYCSAWHSRSGRLLVVVPWWHACEALFLTRPRSSSSFPFLLACDRGPGKAWPTVTAKCCGRKKRENTER